MNNIKLEAKLVCVSLCLNLFLFHRLFRCAFVLRNLDKNTELPEYIR